MKYTLNFLKVITQIAVVATVTFILPAVLHAVVSFNLSHYFNDIQSGDYQFGMGFLTAIVTILYCIAFSMEMDERAARRERESNLANRF